jgi:hypothetical protein
MIPLTTTLLHGLLMCIPFKIFAIVTFWSGRGCGFTACLGHCQAGRAKDRG